MASVGHVAMGLAAGRLWTRPGTIDVARAMVGFSALSLAPDLDVIAFRLGIPYWAPFGHRGASHSFAVALALATVATLVSGEPRRIRLWFLCFGVAASHGLLDTLTDGGLGIALLWPFSNQRYFAPWTPIPVAPIGADMLTAEGFRVVTTESLQFAPLLIWAVWPRRPRG